MNSSLQRIGLLILVPLALATCATFVQLNQIAALPSANGSVVVVGAAGALGTATLQGLTLQGGVLSVPAQAAAAGPAIVVTVVGPSTPNAFPIPSGKTTCLVSRAIMQSPGVDYDVTGGNVVFRASPSPGDVVQLTCF